MRNNICNQIIRTIVFALTVFLIYLFFPSVYVKADVDYTDVDVITVADLKNELQSDEHKRISLITNLKVQNIYGLSVPSRSDIKGPEEEAQGIYEAVPEEGTVEEGEN